MLASVTPPFSRPSQPNQILCRFLLHTIFFFDCFFVLASKEITSCSRGTRAPCSNDADLIVSWTRSD
jgi:hypothetical protein